MNKLMKKFNSLKLTSRIFLVVFTLWGIVLTHSVVSAYQLSYAAPGDIQDKDSSKEGIALNAGQAIKLKDFHKIKLSTAAKLSWKPGESSQCIINKTTDKIMIAVQGETLVIHSNKKNSWFNKSPEDIAIGCSSPSIGEVKIEGAGKVFLSTLVAEDLRVEINGVGGLKANGETNQFSGEINGAGEIELKDLTINLADLEINGTGEFSVPKAKQVKVEINGAGNIQVSRQTEILSQDINGIGSIDVSD